VNRFAEAIHEGPLERQSAVGRDPTDALTDDVLMSLDGRPTADRVLFCSTTRFPTSAGCGNDVTQLGWIRIGLDSIKRLVAGGSKDCVDGFADGVGRTMAAHAVLSETSGCMDGYWSADALRFSLKRPQAPAA
jgi:hypothetical protein